MKVPPPDFSPDATIQLNRGDLPDDLTLHDPEEQPLPSRARTAPPPLPAHALSQAPSPPASPEASQAPIAIAQPEPGTARSPVFYVAILGVVLGVGFGGALLALRVLSPKSAVTPASASAAAGASAVPAAASGSAAPMITIPTVEMN